MSYEAISQDSSLMKHFVGLTSEQFRALHNFLNSICPLDKISYWYSDGQTENKIDNNGQEAKCSKEEMLYVCLLRLRRAYTIKSLAVILSTPSRTIKETLVRKIFTTYIQLLYKVFRDMQDVMFPTRGKMRHFLPKVFKTMKDVQCFVDCTEFHVQTLRNYARQGNTYSSYKHANTFKCLIAVTPNDGACFVSDLFEGDNDDVQIFRECGIMKHIRPHDVILADRGFTVQDLLNPLQADIKISMGTNCAPLLADLFLYSYENEFLDKLIKEGKRKLARRFNLSYRYIDDLISSNNKRFKEFISDIYPKELTISETTESTSVASYLDLLFTRDRSNNITTKLYDKRDAFGFHIVNFPFMSSNIPSAPAYGVYASQLVRYACCCSNYSDFLIRHRALVKRLLSHGYKVNRLSNTFKKFYGRHIDLVGQYKKNVCQMFADSIS